MKFNVYETYTCNPATGQAGWDIQFVAAPSREALATMPNFDCVILTQWTGLTLERCHESRRDGGFCAVEKIWDGEAFH